MQKFEYHTINCEPSELFETLNILGLEGWEFCFLLTMQMTVNHPPPSIHIFDARQKPPEILTRFTLIFKRIKE